MDGADCYIVRKYSDGSFTGAEREKIVDEAEYIETGYDNRKAGFYTVTAAIQTTDGILECRETPVMVKAANTLRVKGKTVKVKAGKLKKKKAVLAVTKVMDLSGGEGKISFAVISGNRKISVDGETGKVTLKKKLKKGTYKVSVKVRAEGDESHYSAARKAVIKVVVK